MFNSTWNVLYVLNINKYICCERTSARALITIKQSPYHGAVKFYENLNAMLEMLELIELVNTQDKVWRRYIHINITYMNVQYLENFMRTWQSDMF